MGNIHFKIIVPFYNVEKWIKFCIRSIKIQNYKNFQCMLVNDKSTDNTVDIIQKEIEKDGRFKLYSKAENTGALGSIYQGIEESSASDEDVIVILDGDDWFYNKESLSVLAQRYEESKCWMTYGSYVEYPLGKSGKFSQQIPEEIIEKQLFRESEWMSSHLRTYKYKLWRRIKKEDLLNSEGKFYPMAADLPTMFPMLEMSGKRSQYIKDTLMVYNRTNPNNEDKVNHQLQLSIENEVRLKPKYKRIEGDI